MSRLQTRFADLAAEGRAGLVTFVMAGDPDPATGQAILNGLPAAGADIIELGMPFSDPMADGPAIQAAGLRALKAGMSLRRVLDLVRGFRTGDDRTPIVLMGYYNPIHAYGVDSFVADAAGAGVDGLIVVDLPPEEDPELRLPAKAAGIDIIRLATPTTDAARLPAVLADLSGFLYYVSMTGVTGVGAPDLTKVGLAVANLRARAGVPVAVGFGVRQPEQAAAIARFADAVVVGSALVEQVASADDPAAAQAGVLELVGKLASGVRSATK